MDVTPGIMLTQATSLLLTNPLKTKCTQASITSDKLSTTHLLTPINLMMAPYHLISCMATLPATVLEGKQPTSGLAAWLPQ